MLPVTKQWKMMSHDLQNILTQRGKKKKGKDKAVCMAVFMAVCHYFLKNRCLQKAQAPNQQALDKKAWIHGWIVIMGGRWDYGNSH